MLAALLVLLSAVPASAQPPVVRKPTHADSLPHRAKPFTVMLRSAAVPGWGQVYNHKLLKAVAVVSVEGLLAFSALREYRLENDAVDRQSAILAAGGDIEGPEYLLAKQDKITHQNRKVSWIWWGIAAHLLQMADAYVDAHLSTFDTDFGPPQSALDPGEKPVLSLAIRTRF